MEEILRKLLGDGHEVTFQPDPEGHGTECVITTKDGDVTTATGATPTAALASAAAAPEAEAAVHLAGLRPAPDCACSHWEAGHFDREDGSRPCGYARCRCTGYRPAPAVPVLPWALSDDGSKWRAQLPDGRTAVIERVLGGDGLGSTMFTPAVYESALDFVTGPPCPGVLAAAQWCQAQAGAAK